MRTVNENILKEILFRFDREDVLTNSWFIGEIVQATGTVRASRASKVLTSMLEAIYWLTDKVFVVEIAVSWQEKRSLTLLHRPVEKIMYSTIYTAAADSNGVSPKSGASMLCNTNYRDVRGVSAWINAKCQVRAPDGQQTTQLLPFLELHVVEHESGRCGVLDSMVTSPIVSLWRRDNRAEMLLIWILADRQLQRNVVCRGVETNWTILRNAIDTAQGDLDAAAKSLSLCAVSDADSDIYSTCGMRLADDTSLVYENGELAEANNVLRQAWCDICCEDESRC